MNYGIIPIHEGSVQATPENAGYRSESLQNLDNLLVHLIEEEKLQCSSYMLSRNGKIFANKSMGKLCGFDERGDLQPDSIRGIASITKIYTTIAILQLIEKAYIYLSQPVSSIISEFDTPIHSGITIFHLLTHTSGLCPDSGYYNEPYPRGWWGNSGDGNWIKSGLSGPVLKKPGEEWIYSSFCFMVLGEIVSRISGIPYEEYVQKNIIEPMGLENTFFSVPKSLHSKVCMLSEREEKRLSPSEEPDNNRPPRSAGGIYSTLEDLTKLGQLMLNKGTFNGHCILGRKTIEIMTTNQIGNIPAFHWGNQFKAYHQGLGWRITSRNTFSSPGTFGHEGAGRSSLYIDPVEQLIAVMIVPSQISWVPESIIGVQGIIWSGLI